MDPPPQKRRSNTNGRQHDYTHICLFIPAARYLDLYYVDIEWFDAVKLHSNPFIENYHLIIVFFHTNISAFTIFFVQKNTHKLSMQGPHTLKVGLPYCRDGQYIQRTPVNLIGLVQERNIVKSGLSYYPVTIFYWWLMWNKS